MIKNIIFTFFLVITCTFYLQAQQLETITQAKNVSNQQLFACGDQFAGNVSLGEVVAQSIATSLPGPIFLCYQDRFTIHNSGADLTGDPDNTTQPGVGYAFFSCPPTATGPDLTTIEADPCVLMPTPTSGDYDFWVYTDQVNGTALFQNSDQLGGQTIPEFFNLGNPLQIYFAPITFDDFANNMDEDGGQCINMNADEAFPVVYLNEIKAVDCVIEIVNNVYEGSFVIEGGYPEYNGSDYTYVSVIKDNINNQMDIIGGPFMHGDIVKFATDGPGTYTILIEDGISCGMLKTIEFLENENEMTITATTPAGPFQVGDFVCVSFCVSDFDLITSMDFTINFDPTVITYNSTLIGPLEDLSAFNIPIYGIDNGFLPFSWFQNSTTGVTLADGVCIFDICFDVVGDPGDCSLITIDGTPTTIEIGCCVNDVVQLNYVGTEICIEEPDQPLIIAGSCPTNGNDEGTITFKVVGGVAPYSYTSDCFPVGTISTSGGSVTIKDLPIGVCLITIVDADGNITSTNVNVIDGSLIDYDIFLKDPSCFGVPNGRIALRDIEGGNPDYKISWSNGFFDVDSIKSLSDGTYFVTIEDQNGCEVEQAFVIGTDPILVDINIIDTTSCFDTENGIVLADAMGGTPKSGNRYDYQWNNPNNFQSNVVTSTNIDIPAGEGTVKVTDDNGCSVNVKYEMPFVKTVNWDTLLSEPLCADDIGTLILSAGTSNNSCGTFEFKWNSGVTSINSPNTSTIDFTESDDFSFTITDCDGCEISNNVEVTVPSPLIAPFFTEFDCTSPTGCIFVFPGGGTGASNEKIITWGDDPTNNGTRCDLDPGKYYFTLTDANDCIYADSVDLQPGSQVLPDTFFVTNISCPEEENGIITVNVPGAGPYNYAWEGPSGSVGGDDPTITNLSEGWYYVTISDDQGCMVVDSAQVQAPDTLFFNPVLSLPVCNGESNGTIALIVTGGDNSSGYTFIWEDFPTNTTELLTSIPPNTYNVTVFDSNGCSKDTTIVMPDQEIIDISINILQDIECNGDTNAEVEVTFTGGKTDNGNYGTKWSTGEDKPLGAITSDTAFIVPAGMNEVIVFDAECADTLVFEIIEPDVISLNQAVTTIVDVSCFSICDGTVQVEAIGGVGDFIYTWTASGNTGAAETDLCAGKQYVDIEDENGCIIRDSVFINQPDSLSVIIDLNNTNNPACNDDGDGLITVLYSGGNIGPVEYTWTDNVSDDASASGLSNGLYGITVTDQNNCSDTTSYLLDSAPPVFADVPSPTEPVCFGQQTCISIENPGGGSGLNYQFTINNSNNFPIDSCVNVFAGEYLITVFDSDGCSFDTTIVIDQPSELLASLGDDIIVEFGDSTNIVEVQLNQSFIIDSIVWTGTQPYECVDDIPCDQIFVFPEIDAIYTVTAVDINGCIATDEIFVKIDDERKVFIPNVFTPNGDGINDHFQLYTGQGVTEVIIFQIFDRWGNKMFEEKNISPNPAGITGWNGTFNDKALSSGVYVYRAEITFIDGKTIPYKGTITLVR